MVLFKQEKGNKAARIKKYVEHKIGLFTKDSSCPDVSESTINRVLNELRNEINLIEPTGLGGVRNGKRNDDKPISSKALPSR